MTNNFVTIYDLFLYDDDVVDIIEYDLFNSVIDQYEENDLKLALEISANEYKFFEKKNRTIDLSKYSIEKKKIFCSICQSNSSDTDDILILNCKHDFHKDCISEWIKYKSECPVCKTNINII
jgi:hypothetical protein